MASGARFLPATVSSQLLLATALGTAMLLPGCRRDSARASADAGWPSYNNTLDGQRYSALREIDTSNVARLKAVCELRLGEEGPFQTGPLVIGDTMFLTTSHTTVAMNATTCVPFWRSVDSSAVQDPISVNRGAAYLGGRLYRGMPGTRLAALDAATGKVLWNVKIGDSSVSEFTSSAPVAWNGTVMIALAGGDWGIRGRVMAYDASNGRELWRFNTIPTGSERGAETWHIPASAEHGGGASWTTYTLDAEAGELFVPVGNPAPDFAPDVRPGDNLFTNSVVVLDAKTGALKWWYQATPRDGFDYDIGAAPMLYTTASGAHRMAVGSKDGHLHDVDRQSHALVFKTPVTTILNADKRPTPEGVRACPGPLGGVEWNGPAFDPASGMMFVGAVDWCATFKSGPIEHKPGDLMMGTEHEGDPTEQSAGWVTALDGNTGAVKWKYRTPKPIVAGLTPTAGGLLFTGDLAGNFYALDKASGRVLFTTNVNGAVAGGVVTYQVAGRQYVATTAGNVSRSTFGESGSPHVVVMALDGAAGRPSMAIALPDVTTLAAAGSDSSGGAGAQKFKQFCSSCHGTHGEGGGGGPSLVTATRKDLAAIVAFVKNPTPPMPKLFPSPLSESDVQAVSQYVRTLQGAAKP
jgi:alcohol dehydrogenase (cytochrome c)